MALTASGISYTYGSGTTFAVEALSGVDITVERGQLVVVAGTTGSGKSTLLRVLAGLMAPARGSVSVDGADPASAEARGRVSMVFQNPESQFFAETILKDVAFGPANLGHADPERSARVALESVGLDPDAFGRRSPFTLSGGEARRAAIAGALAMGAPYVLLDEPTAGLDASGRSQVLAVLDAQRQRAGVVVVTHDPGDVLATADCVLALDGGRTAFAGSVEALFDDPATYESAGLSLPEVPHTQLLARARGARLDAITFDPEAAAEALARWREAMA